MLLKNIITSAITSFIVVALVLVSVGGNPQTAKLGGFTNYDSLNLSTQLSVGSSSPMTTSTSGEAVVDGTATTTLWLNSTSANQGTCIRGKRTDGTSFIAYIATTTWIVSASGSCK